VLTEAQVVALERAKAEKEARRVRERASRQRNAKNRFGTSLALIHPGAGTRCAEGDSRKRKC
jgi:hypothetical protein